MALTTEELDLIFAEVRRTRSTEPILESPNALAARIVLRRTDAGLTPTPSELRAMQRSNWLRDELRAHHLSPLALVLRESQTPHRNRFRDLTRALLRTYRRGTALMAYYQVHDELNEARAWSQQSVQDTNDEWRTLLEAYRTARDELSGAAREFVDAHRELINDCITDAYAVTMDARLRWARARTEGSPTVQQILNFVELVSAEHVATAMRAERDRLRALYRRMREEIGVLRSLRPRPADLEQQLDERREERDRADATTRRILRALEQNGPIMRRVRAARNRISETERAAVQQHLRRLQTSEGRAQVARGLREARDFLRPHLMPEQMSALETDTSTLLAVYSRTLEFLQSGIENFRYQFIAEQSTQIYSPANPLLDMGIREDRPSSGRRRIRRPGLGTYGVHPRWSIDVSLAAGLDTQNIVPDTLVVPRRFDNLAGDFRYVRTRAVGDSTRPTSAIEDVFDKFAEALGYRAGDRSLRSDFPEQQLRLLRRPVPESYEALRTLGAGERTRPPPMVGRPYLRGDRIVPGLTYNEVFADAVVPADIAGLRRRVLVRLGMLLGPVLRDAVIADEGHPSPRRVIDSRTLRPDINQILRENRDGFRDAIWGFMWLLRDRGADPDHREASVTLDHEYSASGREVHVRVLYGHVSWIEPSIADRGELEIARDAVFCKTGTTGGAVGPHHHVEISVYGTEQRRGSEIGYLLPHEFYPDEGGTRPGGAPPVLP